MTHRRLLALGLGILAGELAFLFLYPAGEDYWQHYLAAQQLFGIATADQVAAEWPYEFGYPPSFRIAAALFSPLALLPPASALAVFTGLSFAALAGGVLLFSHLLGWPRPHWAPTLALGLASPLALVNYFMGQTATWILLLFGAALYLDHRGRGFVSGFLLSLGLTKPHLVLGAAAGFALKGRWSNTSGFLVGNLLWFLLAWAVGPMGPAWDAGDYLTNWFVFNRLSVSLVGRLFLLPFPLQVAVSGLLLGLLAVLWRRAASHPRSMALAYLAFLLFIPYVRVYDLIVLTPVMLLPGIRRDGWVWVGAVLVSVGAIASLRYELLDLVTLGLICLGVGLWREAGQDRPVAGIPQSGQA